MFQGICRFCAVLKSKIACVGVRACVQDLFGFQGGGGRAMDLCFFSPVCGKSHSYRIALCLKRSSACLPQSRCEMTFLSVSKQKSHHFRCPQQTRARIASTRADMYTCFFLYVQVSQNRVPFSDVCLRFWYWRVLHQTSPLRQRESKAESARFMTLLCERGCLPRAFAPSTEALP